MAFSTWPIRVTRTLPKLEDLHSTLPGTAELSRSARVW